MFLLHLVDLDQVGFNAFKLCLILDVIVVGLLDVLFDPDSAHFLNAFGALKGMSIFKSSNGNPIFNHVIRPLFLFSNV
jgi:hypothetical protein